MKLNNNEVFALADYLRHQLAVDYPMELYFVDKAAQALEDLANERAELKHQIQMLTTPIINKSNEELDIDSKKQLGNNNDIV
jgi:DNA polymerase I-like protein with 3'-5' exonuclease and polymerase domains